MSDQCEEQELEAEALTAIFDTAFEMISSEQPFQWSIELFPHMDDYEEDGGAVNHVGIKVVAKLPLDYPEHSLPELRIELLKGLAPNHEEELLAMAKEEAEGNLGVPSMYAICERLKEWLTDNNVKGLDDISMHAQMLRRNKEAEKKEQLAKQRELEYESQKKGDEFTEAELEEIAVRKRRAEGTPCSKDNFLIWKQKFDQEMEELALEEKRKAEDDTNKGRKGASKEKKAAEDRAGRKTGKEQFSNTAFSKLDMEAIEAAADQAAIDDVEEGEGNDNDNKNALNVDEQLFDVDDEDLDDLDFDDDEDDEEEEQPDI